MTTMPLACCPTTTDVLMQPELYERRSLTVVPLAAPSGANDPSVTTRARHQYTVLVNRHSLDGSDVQRLGDFPDRNQAEAFRQRVARLLDTDNEIADAAMSLWEATLDLATTAEAIGFSIRSTLNHHGTATLRDTIKGFAEACELEWAAAHQRDEFDAPFDWEWCPKFLQERVTWDATGETLPELKN